MSQVTKTVRVESNDTLSRIARQNRVSLEALLAVNPQIRNPDLLSVGDQIQVPADEFTLTVRFINSWHLPPVGTRYEIIVDDASLAAGRVRLFDNEADIAVADGATVEVRAQRMGDSDLHQVASFVASRAQALVVVRINAGEFREQEKPEANPVLATPQPVQPAPQLRLSASAELGQLPPADKQPTDATRNQALASECACRRDLTLDELAAIFPARPREKLGPFLVPLNQMMAAYRIDTCLRKAHALAQIGHESGSLRYRAEILPAGKTEQEAYDGYKGRGLIQITFKAKYQEYGNYKGVDFLGENRLKLETYEYATDSAGWFWNFGSPYKLSDYADRNDLVLISAAINGGFNGFDDRVSIFARAHKVLRAAACKTEANRSPDYLPFKRSKAYDTRDMAFAWGLWSDPGSTRHGVTKDSAASKTGYLRFLELNNTNPIVRRRFGFTSTDAMIEHAKQRSR